MRKYSEFLGVDEVVVRDNLDKLIDVSTGVEEYRGAFYNLGVELGKLLRASQAKMDFSKVVLACSVEDADWLASGVLRGIDDDGMSVSVFWNSRERLGDGTVLAPIINSFQEELAGKNTIIMVKSIISTSCVVKTQLLRLISHVDPDRIFIVAPVMYKDARASLQSEFVEEINDIMEFISFAVDDELGKDGAVIPGIGGMIYPRLGLGNSTEKNKHFPRLVSERMRRKKSHF